MNFCIDIGNTFCKVGKFEGAKLVEVFPQLQLPDVLSLLEVHKPVHTLLSSVRVLQEEWLWALRQHTSLYLFSSEMPVPIHNHYHTPKTLGLDRVAGVVGAKVLYPQENCLVIDLGTCITFDLIDTQSNYWGGNIAPGLQMRLKAMHTFTDKLPLLTFEDWKEEEDILGRQTTQAMLKGVVHGIAFEIEGYHQQMAEKYTSLSIILSGGDASFFETKVKAPIFAVPLLNLIGLNRILEYNVN